MTARHRMPTQLSAVVIRRGKVLLGRRVHDQRWELPAESAEPEPADPAEVLAGLVRTTTGQAVLVGPEVYDTSLREDGSGPVQLIAFGCHLQGRSPLQISEQYRQVAWLPVDELPLDNIAPGSADAIDAWVHHPEQQGQAGGAAPSSDAG